MSSRKYERYFNPISSQPFSTAGTDRNQGRVGQTSLSRSLVRTTRISRSALPRGNGGTLGNYPVNIVNSCCNNSHSEGKTSMTTTGLLLSRVKNPTGVYNTSCAKDGAFNKQTVKNFDPAVHSNETRIKRLRAKNMQKNWVNLKLNLNGEKRLAPMDISEYLRTQYLYNNPTENCCKSGESGALIPINDWSYN